MSISRFIAGQSDGVTGVSVERKWPCYFHLMNSPSFQSEPISCVQKIVSLLYLLCRYSKNAFLTAHVGLRGRLILLNTVTTMNIQSAEN